MDKIKEVKAVTNATPVKVGISIGDINGIGPEVVMKALSDARMLVDCTPVIYASSKIISYHKKANRVREFNFTPIEDAKDAKRKKINLISLTKEELKFDLGKPTEISGQFALNSLDAATKDLAEGKIDVLVTAPISKEAMNKTEFPFPGHTEYLADMSGEEDALMLMVSDNLRVGLVTTHIPLHEVSSTITKEKIAEKLKAFNSSLQKDFGIKKPKIAVLGLNPHAGENGKMGNEENDVVRPAINEVYENGVLAFGPYPADGFFGSSSRSQFDGVLAMYHDQGLTGFKALAFDEGINYTAGLPIVRTSPDHGTAYDIAGKGKASAVSMRNSIYLAIDVFRNRKIEKEIIENPLLIPIREDKKRGRRRDD